MEIKETLNGQIPVFALSGRLDARNADELQDKIMSAIRLGRHRFVFNLENLEYISSSGLRAFLTICKAIPDSGFVHFYNARNQVLEVFTISGFDAIFKVFNDLESALKD